MTNPEIAFRQATEADLADIVALLADDDLGARREDTSSPIASCYQAAFEAIEADHNQRLVVAVSGASIFGTLQISFVPGISHKGAWRGQIESVRIAADQRGSGLGQQMVQWAIDECRKHGCSMVQLTSDKTRLDARRFYEKLGFATSHEGFKLVF